MEETISILCVDDSPHVGKALARWLERAGGFRFLGQLERTREIPKAAEELKPDVVLMDLNMPGEDVIEAVTQLVRTHPAVRVAMLSGMTDPHEVRRCLSAGACAYLSKDQSPAELAAALVLIAAGRRVLSSQAQAAVDEGP